MAPISADLKEPLDPSKWPKEAMLMEQTAQDARLRTLQAAELFRIGYSGDKKLIGDALADFDETG